MTAIRKAHQQLLDAALEYATRGWRVFPLKGKVPLTREGFKDATVDTDRIRQWWIKDHPGANIGIRCSSKRGPIVVDIDGPSGEKMVRKLALPPTMTARSGRHRYYNPPADGTRVSRIIKVKYKGKGRDADILGDGGYVVAPPSVHPDTRERYTWDSEGGLIEPFPAELLDLIADNQKQDSGVSALPLPERILEGNRDSLLTSLAGSVRRRGGTAEGILALLRAENDARCAPPLSEKDLRRIARSIAKKAPARISGPYTTDTKADTFIRLFGHDVRYVASEKAWYLWDGTHWKRDRMHYIEHMVREVTEELRSALNAERDPAIRAKLEKFVHKSADQGERDKLLRNLRSRPQLASTPEGFDSDRYLLAVTNGTIDLRTGAFKARHRRRDYITRAVPIEYDADAACPRWTRFLGEVMEGDEEMVAYLQRAVGYTLTGDVSEHAVFFMQGKGRNGKSVFLTLLRALIPEHTIQLPFDTLLRGGPSNEQHRHLARLRGARAVIAVEADAGRTLDVTLLKQLSGGDRTAFRLLYGEAGDFDPTHKFWLSANHRPVIKDQTDSTWDRLHIIPFLRYFKASEREKDLDKQLIATELPSILAWAVKGAAEWFAAHDLKPPAKVRAATKEYREAEDDLGPFFVSCCAPDAKAFEPTAALYNAYHNWHLTLTGGNGRPWSQRAFSNALAERRDMESAKFKNVRGWRGYALNRD